MSKVLVPCNLNVSPELPRGWVTARVDPQEVIPIEHSDAEVLVTWGPRGSSERHLRSAVERLDDLRLVQALSAGVDHLVGAGFREKVVIASGSGLHDRPVAEHTLAILLALVRRLPESYEWQKVHQWAPHLGGQQELHPADRVTTLLDARVTIWGFGSIGRAVAELLTTLGASVTGVARTAGTRHGFRVVTPESVADLLPTTDVLIGVLPAMKDTNKAIGADIFRALPDRALVVNVGRGSTLDERALEQALRSGHVAGAALDVFAHEPLEDSDSLWTAPNLIITPHAAGGRPVGVGERIASNVRALVAGDRLIHQVN